MVSLIVGAKAIGMTLPPPQVLFTQSLISNVLNRCPQRVWPGVDWRNTSVTLFSHETGRGWRISGTKGRIEAAGAPPGIKVFQVQEDLRGIHIAINMDATSDVEEPASIMVHELFHGLAQKHWKQESLVGVDIYPIEAEARLNRIMLFNSLKRGKIDHAAYWYQQWRLSSPEEVQITRDRIEGSAIYVEWRALAVNALGCDASAEQLNQELMKRLEHEEVTATTGLDLEGYIMGAAAFYHLARQNYPNWHKRIAEGVSPVELLTDSHIAGAEAVSESFRSEIEDIISFQNEWLEEIFAPLTSALNDPRYFRVAIPAAWQGKYIRFGAMIRPRGNLKLVFQQIAGGQTFKNITLTETNLSYDFPEMICAGATSYLLVPKYMVQIKSGRYQHASEQLQFDFSATHLEVQGLEFLCPSN